MDRGHAFAVRSFARRGKPRTTSSWDDMATSSFCQDRGTGRAWRSVGQIFAHVHNDRLMWFKSSRYPGRVAKRYRGDTVACRETDSGRENSGDLGDAQFERDRARNFFDTVLCPPGCAPVDEDLVIQDELEDREGATLFEEQDVVWAWRLGLG